MSNDEKIYEVAFSIPFENVTMVWYLFKGIFAGGEG